MYLVKQTVIIRVQHPVALWHHFYCIVYKIFNKHFLVSVRSEVFMAVTEESNLLGCGAM
jgi:hypothetical protein